MAVGGNADHAEAWSEFWAKDDGGGCLPSQWRHIQFAQAQMWAQFAARMPRGARVLDLATGDGRVMAALRNVRPDLACQGVDLAKEIPAPPAGTRSHGGVPMESLPF